jgi:gluconokinase
MTGLRLATLAAVSETYETPRSPRDEIDGMPYFPRLCHKVRLHAAGRLHPQYQGNLGGGCDLWTCQFLGVDYPALAEQVRGGKSDAEALAWARENGVTRPDCEVAWWQSFIRTRGFRDDLAERLVQRKAESGFQDRADIQTFFDYMDADEGRM